MSERNPNVMDFMGSIVALAALAAGLQPERFTRWQRAKRLMRRAVFMPVQPPRPRMAALIEDSAKGTARIFDEVAR